MNLTIIGTGLIGSSMALGLRETFSHIVGVNNNPAHVMETLNLGIVDEFLPIEHAIANADAIVLALPVDGILRLLPRVLDTIGEGCTVIDVGSTKGLICNSIKKHPKRNQFVASHPMAGVESSGPTAANPHLFRGRKVVICEGELSSANALALARSIFEILGLRIIHLTAQEHDQAVAQISHLPQLISYCSAALRSTKDDYSTWKELASSGFDSTTRLAASPADIWIPIFNQNKESISQEIASMILMLEDIKNVMDNSNAESLRELIEKANRVRRDFLQEYGGVK